MERSGKISAFRARVKIMPKQARRARMPQAAMAYPAHDRRTARDQQHRARRACSGAGLTFHGPAGRAFPRSHQCVRSGHDGGKPMPTVHVCSIPPHWKTDRRTDNEAIRFLRPPDRDRVGNGTTGECIFRRSRHTATGRGVQGRCPAAMPAGHTGYKTGRSLHATPDCRSFTCMPGHRAG